MADDITHLCKDGSSLCTNPLDEHNYCSKVCDQVDTYDYKYENGNINSTDENRGNEENVDKLSIEDRVKKEVDYLLSLVHRLKEIDFTLRDSDNRYGDVESCSGCNDGNEENEDEKDIGHVSIRDWPWIDQSLSENKSSCIPMTAYDEEQLMKKLSKAIEEADEKKKKLPTDIYLLYRKLRVRKLKRERNLKVFNFDDHISEVLPSDKCQTISDKYYDSHTVQLPKENILSTGPYPDLSSIVSPYTNRLLKPFIWCDTETKPSWLKMLNEIKQRDEINRCKDTNHSAPICYTYIRPQHIAAINSLCSIYFWPGIDISESVQYPDFSCIALYKKLIVGFALMVPDVTATDCYISFLLTRAGWRSSGIATFMLYHLIQTCMGNDITLHVAADNPSLFLYQKFGFKVEQFVKNFYDKYLPLSSQQCKHALFLRLSR